MIRILITIGMVQFVDLRGRPMPVIANEENINVGDVGQNGRDPANRRPFGNIN